MLSGEWRNVDLRPYDVSLAAEPLYPGKEHPLQSVFQQTRRVFLEMGFEEIVSPYVESSFWDFDALFQPQDHPAREMQDTFYVARPARCRLPDEKLVQTVQRTHENGGDTGSVGWRYRWNREIAERPVLRTHTTASTIRALAANPQPPRKVFCVGPVFRRETVDYKHLPVFHQVDGVIIDEQASFATLLGTLAAFYRKMGFERSSSGRAFSPTPSRRSRSSSGPSKKRDWVEMGGAGMFRPEVTEPFGCNVPVLAWGLGLERLACFATSSAASPSSIAPACPGSRRRRYAGSRNPRRHAAGADRHAARPRGSWSSTCSTWAATWRATPPCAASAAGAATTSSRSPRPRTRRCCATTAASTSRTSPSCRSRWAPRT